MSNCVSSRKLIQVPTIIGITWINNSNTIAGTIMRNGVMRFHGNRSRKRTTLPFGWGESRGRCWPTDVAMSSVLLEGSSRPVFAEANAGRDECRASMITGSGAPPVMWTLTLLARGRRLLLGSLEGGANVVLGGRATRRRLLHEAHDGAADVRLERRDAGHERQRSSVVGEDVAPRLEP